MICMKLQWWKTRWILCTFLFQQLMFFLYENNAHWTTIWRLSSSQRYPSLIRWFRKNKISYPWMWWLSLTFEIWRTTKLASSHDTKLWHPYWKQDKDSYCLQNFIQFNASAFTIKVQYLWEHWLPQNTFSTT